MKPLVRTAARVAALLTFAASAPAGASTSGVVISQVYGGNGNTYASDYVELFNAGAAPVSIAGWSIQYASATGTGSFSANGITALSGSLQPGQHYLVQLGTSTGPTLPAADATGTTNLSAASGKVALVNGSTGLACNGSSTPCSAAQQAQIVDLVGYGSANYFEGAAAAPAASSTTALLRAANGCTDSGNNAADFTAGAPAPRNTSAPPVACSSPGNAAIVALCPAAVTVGAGSAVDIALSASDADSTVNAAAFQSGNVAGMSLVDFAAAPAAGGSATVKLNVGATVPAGSYAVAVDFGNDGGQNGLCTVALTVGPVSPSYTPIYTIQGSGTTSPLNGQTVTTRGVVTQVTNAGYFLQDETGDGDPATSDGIFVFTSTAPGVAAGQRLQVTGLVDEFNTGAAGNALTLANRLTELKNTSNLTLLGSGSIAPTLITLPVAAAGELERYEGMLVTVNTPLTVSQNYFQGRYGQVTVSANGRLVKPSNVYRPNSQAAVDLQDLNARRTLLLDDGSSLQNPSPIPFIGEGNTLRAGDTLASLTGVIDYGLATADNAGLALYRIQPTVAPVFSRANPRTAVPPALAGNLKVASFNVLNFFTTFTNGQTAAGQTGQGCAPSGTTADCRGADDLAEFNRQRAKIVAAMAAINADVFGLMELQNNGSVATQNLVDGLNAALGAGTYAVLPNPAAGSGTDAIRVGLIYKPGTLSLVGAALSDTDAVNNRPPLAQTFAAANGQKFSVVVNHMKSKSCSGASGADADQNDGQGCYNDRRKQQAQRLLSFIGTVQQAAGDSDVIVIGDLNAYGQEDPIDLLTAGGLVNQVSRFDADDYSYVFDGEAGYIDHGLATTSMSAQVAGVVHWHINADEPSVIDYNTEFKPQDLYSATPYRASDHDPVLLGLSLTAPAVQTIGFGPLPERILGATDFGLAATASSGLPVSFASQTTAVCTVSGNTVHLLATGLCSIVAEQAGNTAYQPAASVTQSFAVKAFQAISFAPLAGHGLGEGPFALSATASSGLGVVFSSLSAQVCTVAGSTLTLVAAGTCTVAADQTGNGGYAAAAQVVQAFTVAPAAGGGTGGDVDTPTLPQWAALLMGALLLGLGLQARARGGN
ncbi:ExeM/NucH family extracellular endonuclease [Methylibium sp.]|uniref:ExeM/NucH family extracellular endonuclease n=1 Tax=Methylibium sp. TaxID=2067992 RepID=UPI003D1358B0